MPEVVKFSREVQSCAYTVIAKTSERLLRWPAPS